MARPGQPTKLTRLFLGTHLEQRDARKAGDVGCKLLTAMESGCTRQQACAYVGITTRALDLWLSKGNEGKGRSIHALFFLRFHDARARGLSIITQSLAAKAQTDPKVAMFMLERLDPETWGRKVSMKIEGRIATASVTAYVDLRKTLSDETSQALLDELLARAGEAEPRDAGAGDDPQIQGPEALGGLGQVLSIVGGKKNPAAHGEHAAPPRKKLAT